MIKLNDNNIFIGQIKQILKDFNLPNCYVGNINIPNNCLYINNDRIYKKQIDKNTNTDKNILISNFVYDYPFQGLTTNLKINNLLYDRYTHRYLGKYLQFLKVYNGIDLMCMYNCFDQEVETQKDIDFKYHEKEKHFGKNKDGYITYKIPINKLNSGIFSIYLQSSLPIESVLAVQNYFDNNTLTDYNVVVNSYKKLNIATKTLLDLRSFLNVNNSENSSIIIAKEKDFEIFLLLKIPVNIKSSIVVLDGDYISNTYIRDLDANNRTIKNIERYSLGYNINPQLCSYLNTKNYLLSDKLISYLTNNVINKLSREYDIEKAQDYFIIKFGTNPYNKTLNSLYKDILGSWSEADTLATKQIILNDIFDKDIKSTSINTSINFASDYFDRLPYIDNNVEKIIHKEISDYENKMIIGEK